MSSGFSTPAKKGPVTTPRSILKSTPKLANGHMLSTPDSGKRPKRRSNSVLGRLRFGSSSSSSNLGKKVGSKSKLDPASASKKWAEGYGDELPPSDQRTPGGRVRWTSDTPDRTKRDYLIAMAESENPGVLCSVNELPDAARLRAITGSPFKVKKGTEMLVIGFTDGEEGTVNVVYNGEKGIYPGELLAPVPDQPTDKAAYWLPPMFRRVFASIGEAEDTAKRAYASSGADDAISPPPAYNAPHTASPPSDEGGQRRRGNSFGPRPETAGLAEEEVEDSDADADADDWQDDGSDDETALGGRVRTTSGSSEGTGDEPVPQGFSDAPAHEAPVTVQTRPPRDVNNPEGFKRGGRRNSGTFGFGETHTKKEPQLDTPSPPALKSTASASSVYGFSGVPTAGLRAGSDVSLMDGFSMPETEAKNDNAPSMRPFLVRKYTEAPPPPASPLDGLDSSVGEWEAEYRGFGGSTPDASAGFGEMLSAADDAYPDGAETPRKGSIIDEEESYSPTPDFASPGITFMENDGAVLSPLSPADKHRNLHDHMKRGMGTRKLSTYDGFGDIRISPLRPAPPRRSSMYDDFRLSSMDFGDADANKSMDDEVGQAEADLDSDDEWAEYGSVARQSVAFGAEGLSEAEHFLVYSNADRSGAPTICGWMRKPNRWTPEGSHLELSKPRWFELHAGVLYYFREIPLDTVESPVGFIQLTEDVAIEHPDDCRLDIVTRQRRYTIFAGSTDQAELWYTACVSACNFDMDAEAEAAVRSERCNASFDDLQEDADC